MRYCIRFRCTAATWQAPLRLCTAYDGQTFPRYGVRLRRRTGAQTPWTPNCLSIECVARRCQSRSYRRKKPRQRRGLPPSLTPPPTTVIVVATSPIAVESMATSAVNSCSFPRRAWQDETGRAACVVTVDWVESGQTYVTYWRHRSLLINDDVDITPLTDDALTWLISLNHALTTLRISHFQHRRIVWTCSP